MYGNVVLADSHQVSSVLLIELASTMSRFSLLVGSVALLTISGVNAGPCRPSSSVISSDIETAKTSVGVAEPTTGPTSTLTTEVEISGTFSVTLSTAEGVATTESSTTGEDTAITVDITTTEATTTEGLTTIEAATTTEDATSTAETTTAIATTSAEPIPEPRHDCGALANPYTTPNGVSYDIQCNADVLDFTVRSIDIVAHFDECLSKCSTTSGCMGVRYDKRINYCFSLYDLREPTSDSAVDIAFRIGV